ncbi:hypothetical protein AK812_SmicGene15992 [Symbiodinium microadriaticum]|uniref:Uncharacterized protein n=1 Tax=Symbiodinium microadriaticum TaxID=2951 RepID=A0A1Q9E1N0_SYMMI|nr:hypothetical protein AK812_SmicGene15992 [Symbiodinium microadriaticum]
MNVAPAASLLRGRRHPAPAPEGRANKTSRDCLDACGCVAVRERGEAVSGERDRSLALVGSRQVLIPAEVA